SVNHSALTQVAGIATVVDSGGNILTFAGLSLGALADNGGPTKTHALLAGSPCLDAGSNNASLTLHQRGTAHPRRPGAPADMGAFESPNTYVVTINLDEDDGNTNPNDLSLREAIKLTNASADTQERIQFAVNGIIQLSLGEISITDSLIIDG